MQSLNDDMEELYRRAGEDYPLNTGGQDWNKVLQGLQHPESALPEEQKRQKDYKFLWLLLLLPIGFVCGKYVSSDNKRHANKDNKEISINSAPARKTEAETLTLTGIVNNKEQATSGGPVSKKTSLPPAAKANKTVDKIHEVVNKTKKFYKNADGSSGNNSAATRHNVFLPGITPVNKKANSNETKTEILIEQPASVFAEEKQRKTNEVQGKTSSATTTVTTETNAALPASDTSAANKPQGTSSSGNDKKLGLKPTKAVTKNSEPFKRKLSYSFVFGPDLSTVKFYKASKVGYSIGVLLNYPVTRRISVEAGALWNKKNYYASGKYLDTNKLHLPVHSIVSKVDGNCNMIEIPLNLKYDFIIKKDRSWFISAGLSSYLMNREKYDISYERYNQLYVKNYNYKNELANWFSIMNISAGYKALLGNRTAVSIAPYIKLPLQGVGIGKLPISSTGIYISVGRPFH